MAAFAAEDKAEAEAIAAFAKIGREHADIAIDCAADHDDARAEYEDNL